jgi:hypothetical protein
MMNYYEEFGVPKDASVEEIHQAYRTLARVLHPDGQTDEKLRAVAARQMKRLHEILDIFVDPGRRRAYDESLVAAAYPNVVGLHWNPRVPSAGKFELAQSALRYWSWILMVCMILGSGYWYMTARVPDTPESAPKPNRVFSTENRSGPLLQSVQSAAKHQVAEPTGKTRSLPAAEIAVREPSAVRSDSPRLPDIALSMPVTLPVLPPAAASSAREPEVQAPGNKPAVESVARASFAGEWFYVPAIEKPDPHLYAPVEIELQLTEKGGILNGQYRGRYKIPDAAVPQDVVFQAQGKSSPGQSAALLWSSNDGANGEIDLNLVQPNLMKVTWWTTQLGRQPELSSGTATLYRQQTP